MPQHRRISAKLLRNRAPILYHYTRASSLIGIFSHHRLWATNFLSHNDHSELTYGLELALDRIHSELKTATSRPHRRHLEDIRESLAHLPLHQIGAYYASFSENGNLLSQWRAYAGVQGFAIGFRPLISRGRLAFTTPGHGSLSLCRVLYDEQEQARSLDQLLASFEREHSGKRSVDEAVAQIITRASMMKHRGFEEEREWRIMYHPVRISHTDTRELRVRAEGDRLVTYVELVPRTHCKNAEVPRSDLAKLPIDSIICGPSVNISAAMQSLEVLLRQSGYERVRIEISDIPALE